MQRTKFESLVQRALGTIPSEFRNRIRNLAIIVEDEPDPQLLEDMDVPPGDTLYGLYHGTPATVKPWDDGNRLPDRIVIFQGPHERAVDNEDDLVTEIGQTLIHEIGHYFGLSEAEIEEIEDHYWDAQADDAEDSGEDS